MKCYTRSTLLVILLLGVISCHGYSHGRLTPGARWPRPPPRRMGKEDRLPNEVCGRTPRVIAKSIVGGKPASLGEFPWMALIGYTLVGQSEPISWMCGGSLITNRHVLSAAHCLHPTDLTMTLTSGEVIRFRVSKVRLGELDQNESVDDGAFPEDYEVASISVHREWNRTVFLNDIGIITLQRIVKFTDLVLPICLPPFAVRSLVLTPEDIPTVAGWGRLTFNTSGSSVLMKVRVRVADLDQCRANYTAAQTSDQPTVMDDSVICAGATGKGSCNGDSGGPLMYYYDTTGRRTMGRWYQIGVVSYGPDVCARDGLPGVYSSVSEHMPWIMANLDI